MEQKTIVNPTVLDGEPKVTVLRRPDIKLATHPEISVAMPIGDKEVGQVLTCDKSLGGCGMQFYQHGFRHPDLVPRPLMVAHMNLNPPLNTTMAYMFETGRKSAEARQIMTKKAMRMGSKYILYWDDDTLPPQLALYTMHTWMEMHPDAGAITAIYTTRQDPPVPLVFEKHGCGPGWNIPMGPGSKPVPIFGAGAGFLLVRVAAIQAVIDKMKEDGGEEIPVWQDIRTCPAESYNPDLPMRDQIDVVWGHDIRFCKLLNEADWPVYAHGAILCEHWDIEQSKAFVVPDDAPGMIQQKESKEQLELPFPLIEEVTIDEEK